MAKKYIYTTEEARTIFIKKIQDSIEYWLEQDVTEKEKLEGLAHTIMSVIDGGTDLPAFELTPIKGWEETGFPKKDIAGNLAFMVVNT